MGRTRLMLWLAIGGGLGLALLLLPVVADGTVPILAAGGSSGEPVDSGRGVSVLAPLAQITCTLATTTTDALPNINSFADAAILASYDDLALVVGNKGDSVAPEEDYFRLDNAIPDYTYEVDAVPDGLGNYNLGIVVYDASYVPIMTDTNTLDGNSATVELVADSTGPYYFKVFQISNFCSGDTYYLNASSRPPATSTPTSTPGPTSTPKPTATPFGGVDRFEPNYDFDHATTLATGKLYEGLNFVPWGGTEEDNDFYKLWVKPGLFFSCETEDLAPGVDPNMIFFDNDRNAVTGNDDIELGDYNSRLSYYTSYEGYLYVLVGHGGRLPLAEVQNSTYSLLCTMAVPGASTPVPARTATPRPTASPTSPGSPLPTPTPSEVLTVRELTSPTPPPVSGTPGLQFVPIDLLVYYDANDDHSPGAGEGVTGVLVVAHDTATGEQIVQGFTDGQGHLQFTATAQGAVRLTIPYLGVSHVVGREGATVYVRVAAQPLPSTVP